MELITAENQELKRKNLGSIPEDWDVLKTESIIDEISMGPFGSNIKVSNFINEGVPVLSGINVQSIKLTDKFKNYVTEEKAKELNKAVAQRGDIVITHRGTLGQVSYIPEDSEYEKYVISQSQFRVRFKESIVIPQWVALYFLSENGTKNLLEGKGHTGVPAIAQATTTFRNLYIPIPSISEQESIATALSDVDELIRTLDGLIQKKQAIKKGTMQQLLTGKKRLPGFDGEWEVKKLGDLIRLEGGFAFSSEYYSDKGPILLTPGNFKLTGGLYFTDRNTKRFVGPYNKRQVFSKGDLLIVMTDLTPDCNLLGKPAFVNLNEEILHNQRIGKVELLNSSINESFLYYYFLSQEYLDHVKSTSTGSTVSHTSNGKIYNAKITCPSSIEEQKAIAQILSDMDRELQTLRQKRGKYMQIKQGMMQELLTGKTRLV